MKRFEDSDLIVQKAVASKVLKDLAVPALKTGKVVEKISQDIMEIEAKLESADNVRAVSIFSHELQSKQASLVMALAIKKRIDDILSKNRQRLSFISQILSDDGIYNQKFSKQQIIDIEKKEKPNISEDNLNLNLVEGKTISRRFFEGELLTFVDNKLDFSLQDNANVAISSSTELFTKIIMTYPESASSVPESLFLDINFKQKFLKAITAYASEKAKIMSMGDINKSLGGILRFKTQITRTVADFVAGVQNLTNVIAKQQVELKYPNLKTEIKSKLKCNEASELLPQSKIVAVLAEGLAGKEIKTEEQQSEEVRKQKEQETEKVAEFDNYLEKLFSEMLALEEEEFELALKEEQTRQEIKEQEKQAKKEQEESEAEKLGMEQVLNKSFSKHDD